MRGMFRNVLTILAAAAVLSASGINAAEQADGRERPQELQTSAEPARQRVIPEGYYPVTQVRLPERMQRAANEIESRGWFHNFAAGENDIFSDRLIETRIQEPQDAWFSNFAAGGNLIFDDGAQIIERKNSSWFDNFAAGGNDFFEDTGSDGRVEREARVDDEGYLIFSGAHSSSAAYASMALPDMYYDEVTEGDGVRIPKAFSFDSDDSPIIVAEVASPGSDRPEMASRGRTLFNMFGGGRRAAEIIEREPIEPQPRNDTPAMVPPAGGKLRRAEVKLPTSSQGLGMAGGYFPGR